jgi:hypothetical protein
MKNNISAAVFVLYIITIGACTAVNNLISYPVPEYFENGKIENSVVISDIVETKEGKGVISLPVWLSAFINGGIEEAEDNDAYSGRYLFIGMHEGINFDAMNKWTKNYTITQDFPRLAAARIEKRMISAATLYPDDEYGIFYETMVKKAYSGEYPEAVIEDTYWVKTKANSNDNMPDQNNFFEVYKFFVFISIDKTTMQTTIKNMMSEANAAATPTRFQRAAINRLQQNFFEGF